MNFFGLVVAVAVTGHSVDTATPSTPPPSEMSKEQAAAEIMDYYPARARAGGVEGNASLKCHTNEHARWMDCVLTQENPAGFGFGEAALALARLARDNPQISQTSTSMALFVEFKFKLKPPSIEPNTLLPLAAPVIITNPDYLERPDFRRMAYPDGARRAHVKGRVVLSCVVNEKGKVKACVVTKESPAGFEFGRAAIDFVSTFKMRPQLRNGLPVGGARVTFPINFRPG